MKIPIVFGVIGHRNLRPEDYFILKKKVTGILSGFIKSYPTSEICMLNSLAEGADQLCCDVALELGIPYTAVLPMPIELYQEDFSSDVLVHFKDLLRQAQSVIIVSHPEQTRTLSRDDCYRQSGLYLNNHSHFMLALWNGGKGDIEGCGTASIATLKRLDTSFYEQTLLTSDSGGVVIQVVTPRLNGAQLDHAFEVIVHESRPGRLDEILKSTDEFNRDTEEINAFSSTLIEETMLRNTDPLQHKLHDLYQTSDALSLKFRQCYLSAVKQMSICAVSLVVSFLLYDELEADIFLFLYGLVVILTYVIFQRSKQKKYLRKYLEYRVLAETSRTQFFMSLLGVDQNVCAYFNFSQKQSLWIRLALSSIHDTHETRKTFDIQSVKRYWIDDQLDYYKKALKKTIQADQLNSKASNIMLACSLAVFMIVLILEMVSKDILTLVLPLDSLRSIMMVHADSVIIVRGVLKILLGLFSSITLFLSVYYGKLSLKSKVCDYEKMIRIYTTAQRRFDDPEIAKESLFIDLAKEEIRENGNWFEYSQGNEVTPEI